MLRFPNHIRNLSEGGTTLIEVLVALVLIAIISLGVASNVIGSMQIARKTEINYAASNLALSKVEQLSAQRVSDLSSANNSVEEDLTSSGLPTKFKRTTTITVNSDQSRTILVRVESTGSNLQTALDFETTFSVWQ